MQLLDNTNDTLTFIGIGPSAHGDRKVPPIPHDAFHQMGHIGIPEFLEPLSISHFHPPVMPMPPHVMPGPGIAAVPHPHFIPPFHSVPIISFHEPWVND